MSELLKDPHFRVDVISKTDRPNLLCYLAMHQDYSETDCEYDKFVGLSEAELGDRLVRNCVNKSHWGILEHPSITFNVVGYPHSVIVQARTHRVGVSFDCQSQRYTGERISKILKYINDHENTEEYYADCIPLDKANCIEEVMYFRPVGEYLDRQGNKYKYKQQERELDILFTRDGMEYYCDKVINCGYAPEHARDFLPQNIRQNFVVTFNARSLLHFCDMRLPADAQLEIRDLATRLFEHFKEWMPSVAEFYEKKRYGRNQLAP
jgi:thymidylate synthase (FAD)